MESEWNDSQPIYRQLRDRVVAMILDGVLNEGDPLPSVRNVAAEFRVNPLTVLKAYQELVDEELVESRRGLGMFVKAGARNLLLKGEREKFLTEHWPRVHATRRPMRGIRATLTCGAWCTILRPAPFRAPAWPFPTCNGGGQEPRQGLEQLMGR